MASIVGMLYEAPKDLIIKAEIFTWSERFIKSNPSVPVYLISV